jgi:hypothetical protein
MEVRTNRMASKYRKRMTNSTRMRRSREQAAGDALIEPPSIPLVMPDLE